MKRPAYPPFVFQLVQFDLQGFITLPQDHPVALDRLTHRLENWKRQLIDLSRRNRLLNYKPTKASTVEVVDEVPQLVLRHLLEGRTFRFDPKPELEGEVVDGGAQDGEAQDGSGEKQIGTRAGRSYETGRTLENTQAQELSEGHTDDRLQTSLTLQRLEGNLLAIYRRAEESMEEQGVNTLFLALGMLEWHESGDSSTRSKAPLIMVPVELRRQTASSPFVLALGDDGLLLNPAIVEKLRLDFGVQLPDLPEMTDDLDLNVVWEALRGSIIDFPTWRLTADIALGLFSFQKFIMYRDIERNEEKLRAHHVIRAICQEGGSTGSSGLPPDVANADLDEEMSPWSSVQVLDADSSQQRAILAVKKGNDLVIEGPPGTGKSQTITNLIADALHDGKTVLFVAEKMAALEVVRSRLEHSAGLGDHVLELHSNKTSKREFVETLTRALDRGESPVTEHEGELQRLQQLTSELREYVVRLHEPVSPLGRSPYQGIAALAAVHEATQVTAGVPNVRDATADALAGATQVLDNLARSLREVGDPRRHPLRGVGLQNAGRNERATLEQELAEAGAALSDLTDAAHAVAGELGLRSPETLGEAQAMVEGARTVARSPGAEVSVLENSGWNQMSSGVEELLTIGSRYAEARVRVDQRFRSDAVERDLSSEISEFAAHLEQGVWRYFLPAFWKVRGNLMQLALPVYRPGGAQGLLRDLREASACRSDLLRIRGEDFLGRELFGSRWQGEQSDWSDLKSFADWVVQFRSYALRELLGSRGLQIAAAADIDTAEAEQKIDALSAAIDRARASLLALVAAGALTDESGIAVNPGARTGELAMRVNEIEGALDQLRTFSGFVAAEHACRASLASEFVPAAVAAELSPDQLTRSFHRLFFELWLEKVFEERPVLARFHAAHHEERVHAFRELDRKSLEIAEDRARAALGQKRRELMQPELQGQLQLLQREARKRSRIMPVRKLLARTPDVIQLIKPCFMMSPLSVAQYLDPDLMSFDLIVFDEASQIPPSDAIGAIIRAERVVVVGDSKQLPPTNFFGVHLDDAEVQEDEEIEMLEDLESILDEVAVAGIPSLRLKWHYRSQHQSLIRFSNEEFYSDDPLYVFPAAVLEDRELGLKLEIVEGGVYEGGGQNTVEARRVADAVVQHIRDSPTHSLGVGTFGIKQQQLILDELDSLRRKDPSIEWFFNQEGEKKFFVKNLENIQGDDRDVIFLSVTYGPDENGVIRRNFGPINKQGGWRRLNVLTTRAKRLMRVFSSMRADQIDTQGLSEGAVLLQQYLRYAETGEYPRAKISTGSADSPFELSVMRALERRGYRVVAQVGDAGYRIDLAVIDSELPGRYICGVECDGATYHSAATVRDRDRLRQQVLELRGWDIHRVWSTDWFHDPRSQLDRLVRLIEDSRERARIADSMPPIIVEAEARPLAPEAVEAPETSGSELPRVELAEIEVPVYCFAPLVERGMPEDFYTVTIGHIADAALEIVRTESPIHASELSRRVAACWGMQRAGRQIAERVRRAVALLVRNGAIEFDEEFARLNSGAPVRVRSRAIDGVVFSSDHISPVEVVAAVRLLLEHRAPLLPDELIAETARLLGFSRTGSKLRERIVAAKDQLVASGELRAGSRGIHLANPAAGPLTGS